MKRILQGVAVVLALGAMAQTVVQANSEQKGKSDSIKEAAPKGDSGKKEGGGGNEPKSPSANKGDPGI